MDSELYKAIKQQFLRMMARNLERTPKAEELPFCIRVLTDDLMNCGYTDTESLKVAEAIDRFGRDAKAWPTTRDIQATLRDLAHHNYMNRNDYKSLPEPSTEKQRRKDTGMKEIAKMKSLLT